jgi:hypothetical protein
MLTQTTLHSVFHRQGSSPISPGSAPHPDSAPTPTSTSKDKYRVSKKPAPVKSRSSSKSEASADNRVMTDVLMAIKPVHLKNIASRQKNHEYRKYRLRDEVTRLWFYETADGGAGSSSIT